MRTRHDNLLEERVDDLARRLREVEQRLGDLEMHVTVALTTERQKAKPYMTAREAANYLSVSRSLLSRWRCDLPGGPPFRKVGTRVLYSPADLDKFIEDRRRTLPRHGPS